MKSIALAFCVFQLTVLPAKYHIKKIWLFSRTTYSGNVPVRPDGKLASGQSRSLLCFLEIDKNATMPDWQTAWLGGDKFRVAVSPVGPDSLIVGTEKSTGKKMALKPGDSTRLVQLILVLQEHTSNEKEEGFTLAGVFNKKQVRLSSNVPVVELATPLMP